MAASAPDNGGVYRGYYGAAPLGAHHTEFSATASRRSTKACTVAVVLALLGAVSWTVGAMTPTAPRAVVRPDVSVKGTNWTPWARIDVADDMVREQYLPPTADEGALCDHGVRALIVSMAPTEGDYLYDRFSFASECASAPWSDHRRMAEAAAQPPCFAEACAPVAAECSTADELLLPECEECAVCLGLIDGEAGYGDDSFRVSCEEFDSELPGNENVTTQSTRIFGLQVERFEITAANLHPNVTALNRTELRAFKETAQRLRDTVRVRAICDFDKHDLSPSVFSAWAGRSEGALKQTEGVYCEPLYDERGRMRVNNVQKIHVQVFHDRGYDFESFRMQLRCGSQHSAPAHSADGEAADLHGGEGSALHRPGPLALLAEKMLAAAKALKRPLDQSIGYHQGDPAKDHRSGFFSHFVNRRR